MTEKEKLIVTAYTGILMCDFGTLHKYVEEQLGRPILTNELGDKELWKELKEVVKPEFMKLCDNKKYNDK